MDYKQALFSTVTLLLITVILEIICRSRGVDMFEKFSNNKCDECTAEPFINNNKSTGSCRVVCDANKPQTIEKFTNDVAATATATADVAVAQTVTAPVAAPVAAPQIGEQVAKPTVAQDNYQEVPVNDDRFYWGTKYGNKGYNDNYGFNGMFYDENPFYNTADVKNKSPLNAYEKESDRREQDTLAIAQRREEYNNRTQEPYDSNYQAVGEKSQVLRTHDSLRRIEGELDDEMPYSDFNNLPVGNGYKSRDYEYGYSFLPPEKWFPQPPRPPICVAEKRCPVCPVYTQGAPVDVKEFDASRRITQPDRINVEYINDKLNAGT